MIKITHIINPVKVTESSDLFKAQPITFETMKIAKAFAKEVVDVSLVTTQFDEDESIIPDYFYKTKNLDRSILDFYDFKVKRKLPLLNDILERAIEFDPSADYIVYTNVDIALLPHFYEFVNEQINDGLDAFVINRRTISAKYSSIENLSLMFSDIGKPHPGYDCFVFRKELFNKFILNNPAIGVSKVGITLLANLLCFSNKFKVFSSEHITFHLGEDKVWQNESLNDYFIYNCKEAYKTYQTLLDINSSLDRNLIFGKHLNLLKKGLNVGVAEGKLNVDTGNKLLKRIKTKLRKF